MPSHQVQAYCFYCERTSGNLGVEFLKKAIHSLRKVGYKIRSRGRCKRCCRPRSDVPSDSEEDQESFGNISYGVAGVGRRASSPPVKPLRDLFEPDSKKKSAKEIRCKSDMLAKKRLKYLKRWQREHLPSSSMAWRPARHSRQRRVMCECMDVLTPEHLVQSCSNFRARRDELFPTRSSLEDKLFGSVEDLNKASILFQEAMQRLFPSSTCALVNVKRQIVAD